MYARTIREAHTCAECSVQGLDGAEGGKSEHLTLSRVGKRECEPTVRASYQSRGNGPAVAMSKTIAASN
jgi:hypothetical protein